MANNIALNFRINGGGIFELDNVNPTITVRALKTMIRNGNYVTSTIFELYRNDFAREVEENMKDEATVGAYFNGIPDSNRIHIIIR
ncbi:17048_t:CDS:1, partial [Racocetra fulgida]